MPSSAVCMSPGSAPSFRRAATGTISASKRPAFVAAMALRWLRSA
jgi:hypothetical protein